MSKKDISSYLLVLDGRTDSHKTVEFYCVTEFKNRKRNYTPRVKVECSKLPDICDFLCTEKIYSMRKPVDGPRPFEIFNTATVYTTDTHGLFLIIGHETTPHSQILFASTRKAIKEVERIKGELEALIEHEPITS